MKQNLYLYIAKDTVTTDSCIAFQLYFSSSSSSSFVCSGRTIVAIVFMRWIPHFELILMDADCLGQVGHRGH